MLTTQDRMLIEQQVSNDKPSTGIAYLLALLIIGLFGAHRFYLGRTGSAITMLILTLTFFGLAITGVWLFIDLFRIPGMVREKTEEIRTEYTRQAVSRAAMNEQSAGNAPLARF